MLAVGGEVAGVGVDRGTGEIPARVQEEIPADAEQVGVAGCGGEEHGGGLGDVASDRGRRRRTAVDDVAGDKLNDELLAAATRRYLAGEPMTSLCDDLGINPTTPRRALTKIGFQLRRPGRPSALRHG